MPSGDRSGLQDQADIDQEKASARRVHNYALAFVGLKETQGVYHSPKANSNLQAFGAALFQCNYVVFNSASFTTAQKVKWADEILSGPTDGQSDFAIYEVMEAILDNLIPTGPSAWSRPDSAARYAFAACIMETSQWTAGEDITISDVDLFGGTWIDSLA